MTRPLFLHEVIDVVGQGAVPYMEHTVAFDTEAAGRGLALFGTWYVMGSTGRWPQVVNVWELIDGWDGWRRLCDRTNLRREANTDLSTWWDEALQYRTGGFDRLLGGVDGCPTLTELTTEGVRGTLFVHEISRVRPGAGPEYLAAVFDELAPLRAELGHTLVGLWEVLLSDTEVCTLWATNLDAHVVAMAAADAGPLRHPGLAAWSRRRTTWTTAWGEELLVPCPGTPLGPPAWAE
jgi:hypothetical protein